MKGFGNYFWGFFLIGVGLLLVIKFYFKLSIPTVRVVGGIFFIALGLSWLLGGFQIHSGTDMIFTEGTLKAIQSEDDYNIIFSNGVVDLTTLSLKDGNTKIKVNVVFGNGIIKIDPNMPVVIKVNSAFAKAQTPDGSSTVLGEHTYRTREAGEDKVLFIDASVVFGQLEVLGSP